MLIELAKMLASRFGIVERDGAFHSGNRRIVIEPVGDNVRVAATVLIGDDLIKIGSIEMEPYRRDFWEDVAIAIGIYALVERRQAQALAALFVLDTPATSQFVGERERLSLDIPKTPLKAGRSHRGATGTIKSKRGAKAAFEEPDVLDVASDLDSDGLGH